MPYLHLDLDEWTRFEAARRAISHRFTNSVPVPDTTLVYPRRHERGLREFQMPSTEAA